MVNKILRLPEVKEITGLSRSSIYLAMKEGTFPKSIPLGKRSIGWHSQAIYDWIDERVNATQQEARNG